MSRILTALIFCALFAFGVFAQTPSAEITGVVTDASGATISGASVTVTNPQTGLSRAGRTNDAGVYSIPSLPPGTYNVRVENTGFSSQSGTGVELQTSQVASSIFHFKWVTSQKLWR